MVALDKRRIFPTSVVVVVVVVFVRWLSSRSPVLSIGASAKIICEREVAECPNEEFTQPKGPNFRPSGDPKNALLSPRAP